MIPNNIKHEQKPICKFYLNYNCKFGDSCKHYHPKNKQKQYNQTNVPKQMINKKSIPQQEDDSKQNQLQAKALANSAKAVCLGCKNQAFLVYLSCGCHNLCQGCAKNKKKCQNGHQYDEIWIV